MKRHTNYLLLFFVLLFSGCNTTENRNKLIILDTGLNVTSELRPFLCEDGHKSFLPSRAWDQDREGHGTLIVKTIAEKINYNRSCIVVFKTADKGLESSKRAEAYATALVNLTRNHSDDVKVILLALEDVSYFYKEIEWFNSILANPNVKIVIAAGNSGVQLRENNSCPTYPACLKNKLSNEEVQSRFVIVGSTDGNFNDGPMLDVKRRSGGLGTSISAARYASELMD